MRDKCKGDPGETEARVRRRQTARVTEKEARRKDFRMKQNPDRSELNLRPQGKQRLRDRETDRLRGRKVKVTEGKSGVRLKKDIYSEEVNSQWSVTSGVRWGCAVEVGMVLIKKKRRRALSCLQEIS